MTYRTLVIHMPPSMSDVRIIKQIDFDEGDSIQIDISNLLSDIEEERNNEQLFFCSQHKQKTSFHPADYAYIESTSNHYSQWYPINPEEPVLSIYTRSLGNIYTKLQSAGLNYFWRVHSSYIVNSRCIHSFKNEKIILNEHLRAIPIGKEYKDDFFNRVTVF